MREKFGQFVLAGESGNPRELRLQRLESVPVDHVRGGAGSVVVADFLFVRAALGTGGSGAIEHGMKNCFCVLGHHRARAVSGTIIRNGIELAEVAAGVLEEIDAGVGAGVDQILVQAGEKLRGLVSVNCGRILSLGQ